MDTLVGRLRRFFWWCAAADRHVLEHTAVPSLEGMKYTALGAVVLLTSTAATAGWIHMLTMTSSEEVTSFFPAVAFASLMGTLLFTMERALLVSLPPSGRALGLAVAFAWRTVLASVSALVLFIAFAVTYFYADIVAHLDTNKLAEMQRKRAVIDEMFHLSKTSAAIRDTDDAIARNLRERHHLPIEIQELISQKDACVREHQRLIADISSKIAAAQSEREALNKALAINSAERAPLSQRINKLSSDILGWNRSLSVKSTSCTILTQRVTDEKNRYFEQMQQHYKGLMITKVQQEGTLDDAQRNAKVVLDHSDRAVAQRNKPGLWASVRALYALCREEAAIAVTAAILYGFFFLIECLPIVTKLAARSTYEQVIGGEAAKKKAEIEAEVNIVRNRWLIKEEMVQAELHGTRDFYRTSVNGDFAEIAQIKSTCEVAKLEVLVPFAQVEAFADALVRARAAVDNASGVAGEAQSTGTSEMLHELLALATKSAAKRFQTFQPGGDRITPLSQPVT